VQVEAKVLPPEVSFTTIRGDDLPRSDPRTRPGSSGLLIGLLVAIILVLLVLWLSGVRPETLFK
jgi:hypothetical protein